MAYNHNRMIRETIAYAGTSYLETANRLGISAEELDRGMCSLRRIHEVTGVPFEKMEELGRN